jgi:hypothetical protein
VWINDQPLPAKISKIYKQRGTYLEYLRPLVGTVPKRSDILEVVSTITNRFKAFRENPSFGGLYKTIEGFVIGRYVTLETVEALSKVLAGNEVDMRIGKVISPAVTYSGTKFVLSRITDCFISYKEAADPKYVVYFEFLDTEHAGSQFKTSITKRTLKRLQAHVGLRGKYEDIRVHHREIVGSYVFIKPCINEDWKYVADWAITSTLRSRNKKLFKDRDPKTRFCPFNLKIPCFMCPVGSDVKYLKRCPNSTHTKHYSKAVCSSCDQVGLVDESSWSGHCLDCQNFFWHGK